MIAVIADDLTGAAELAGAAHALGLSAEVQTSWQPVAGVDVIALNTDTRSLPADEATQRVLDFSRAVRASQPEWIYKKTDSVLRGHVRQEIESILDACHLSNALLVPANPSKGRIIRHGIYTIHGAPLRETDFAHDPDHPRRSSRVSELIGVSSKIHVPDTISAEDLKHHTANLEADTLPAGAVDFFATLLEARRRGTAAHPAGHSSNIITPALFVCGSANAWNRGRDRQFMEAGVPLVTLPDAAFTTNWTNAHASEHAAVLEQMLAEHPRVAAAIGNHRAGLDCTPSTLAIRLCATAALALSRAGVETVCIEGGATASALLQVLHYSRLSVIRQWAGGVVELRPPEQHTPSFILKVGSYDWPASLLRG